MYLDTAAPQTRVAHHHHALPGLGPGGVAELAPGHHSRLVVEQVWHISEIQQLTHIIIFIYIRHFKAASSCRFAVYCRCLLIKEAIVAFVFKYFFKNNEIQNAVDPSRSVPLTCVSVSV